MRTGTCVSRSATTSANVYLPRLRNGSAIAERLQGRVVVLVRPADVEPREQPRRDDHECAEQDPEAQASAHLPAEQWFVERDERDEAEVDRDHGRREHDRNPVARARK